MKITAVAPANIALIKFWGKIDERLRIPANDSFSVNLSGLKTITTVEFSPNYLQDQILINQKKDKKKENRVIVFLDLIREKAKTNLRAKVVSQNNFPTGEGMASSASGFAALTLAATKSLGLSLSEKELTIIARQGSGSACRSIPDGYVWWHAGKTSNQSYAETIFPSDWWPINIVSVVVKNNQEKDIPTTNGHPLAWTSPFFKVRLKNINNKISLLKQLIKERKFIQFGELIEQEALEMHAIMLTSTPALVYWQPETLAIIRLVKQWRKENLAVYLTIDAGPNLHLFCQDKDKDSLIKKINRTKLAENIIVSQPTKGARFSNNHLF